MAAIALRILAARYREHVKDEQILPVLRECAAAISDAIEGHQRRGYSGVRETQYHLDLVADAAALKILRTAGFRVVSEESGVTGDGSLTVVVDPIDGSTNCDRGIPFFATSLAVIRNGELIASLVVNQATGTRFEAMRGAGARRDDVAIRASGLTEMDLALVSFSGLPSRHLGWAQVRALGAASLECCLVADGSLDIFAVAQRSTLSPWDYLGGLLVARESGAHVGEYRGDVLVTDERVGRRPIFAASEELLRSMLVAGPL
jgi:fructose-1,6-bisphosphatase/inositol monophosphatase family enzyme